MGQARETQGEPGGTGLGQQPRLGLEGPKSRDQQCTSHISLSRGPQSRGSRGWWRTGQTGGPGVVLLLSGDGSWGAWPQGTVLPELGGSENLVYEDS